MKIKECPECVAYLRFLPLLTLEACASVALDRDTSMQEVLVAYVSDYHGRGHKERQS